MQPARSEDYVVKDFIAWHSLREIIGLKNLLRTECQGAIRCSICGKKRFSWSFLPLTFFAKQQIWWILKNGLSNFENIANTYGEQNSWNIPYSLSAGNWLSWSTVNRKLNEEGGSNIALLLLRNKSLVYILCLISLDLKRNPIYHTFIGFISYRHSY